MGADGIWVLKAQYFTLMRESLFSLLRGTSFLGLNPEKSVVAPNPASVALVNIPAEVMLSLLPKPRAPKAQSLLWGECQTDRVPGTSPALPGLVLPLYPGELPGKLGC